VSLKLRAVDGSLAAWAPAAPPKALFLVEAKPAGPLTAARAAAAAAAVRGTLAFLGYEAVDAPAKTADLRLLIGPASIKTADFGSQGFSLADFHYYCLKTHPREPLLFSWDGLAAARGELSDLLAANRSLAGVNLEPSSRGVTGYLHRFRESLSRDLDFPQALSCVWDGLRPGALSPGSKAAFLRATMPALGLE
jgi:hypothetical protein